MKIDKKKTIEELAREERLAYFREWRANNKDKVKQHQATYWQRRAERIGVSADRCENAMARAVMGLE